MTNRKSTKKALLMSALSLLLCCSMLIGTTFAWFTDEVTSGVNQIVAGNLDVDVVTADNQSIEGVTTLFNDVTLWEPGAVAYEVLTVQNLGTLALKYQMSVNFDNENTVNGYGLSQILKIAVVDAAELTDRDSALAAAKAASSAGTLYDFTLSGNLNANDHTTDTYGIVIWWEPSDADNNWNVNNGKTTSDGMEYLHIDLGIKLVATQLANEEDSWDETYDENASYPGEANTAEELIAALTAGQNVKLGKDIDLAGIAWEPIASYSGVFDGNGHTISNLKGENGLFDNLSGATIKNLKLENVDIDATSNHTGAVAGYINKSQGRQTVIENVTVSGTVNGGEYYVGGLIGADSNYDTVIRDCTNNATVVAPGQQVGGIVGYTTRGTVVENCVNNGDITGGSFVGGIIGMAAGDDDMAELFTMVKDCTNTGAVAETALDPSVTWQGGVGGIIGNIGRAAGDPAVKELKFYIVDCTVADGQAVYGQKHNVAGGHENLLTVYVGEAFAPGEVTDIVNAIKALGQNESKIFFLTDGEYSGDMELTVAALGANKNGDLAFIALPGTEPVFTGTVTMGYYQKGDNNSKRLETNITFEGIKFDHNLAEHNSLDVQNVKSLTMTNCTVIGDGEYGISSPGSNNTGASLIQECTFVNAGLQINGNFGKNLIIEDCSFTESCVNVQGGTNVTIQRCTFKNTVTDAHNNESFYAVRSNAIPITITNCEFSVDSTVTGIGVAGSKGWGVFVNRKTANWTVSDVKITMTEAAMAQDALVVAKCLSTGKINMTNVTVNGALYVDDTAALNTAISNGVSAVWIAKGADLTGFERTVLTKDLTIYGNGASLPAAEDFAVEFHNGANYPFAGDVTLTIYDLDDVTVWGSRCSEYAFNLNLYNCDDCRIFIMGTTGANNIYMNNCTVTRDGIGQDTAVYSNANGSIVAENCTFTGIECPFNLNHKVVGEMSVTVTDCTFVDCGTTGTQDYYAPIRLCNNTEGAAQTLTVSGCTFTYSEGKAPVNGADVLLNADKVGTNDKGTISASVQDDAIVKAGINVTLN